MTEVIILDETQVYAVYMQHIREAFPESELKPYWKIQDALQKGAYMCYGMQENGVLVAYAFFMQTASQDILLLDYYGVVSHKRGQGYGSLFLRQLESSITKKILGEVEDPNRTADPAERVLQQRRIQFYVNNGFIDTGVRCKFYGVYYRILSKCVHEKAREMVKICAVKRFYKQVYHNAIPKKKLRFWAAKRRRVSLL